ncbi:unnamed protein product [Gadus morhua 'NCC']
MKTLPWTQIFWSGKRSGCKRNINLINKEGISNSSMLALRLVLVCCQGTTRCFVAQETVEVKEMLTNSISIQLCRVQVE